MTDIAGEHHERDEDRADVGRRRREFIRAHHPDRGGDAETFIAGLRGFDDGQQPTGTDPQPKVTAFARRSWPTRMATAAVRRICHGKPPARVR
jgi:hypothetical protein